MVLLRRLEQMSAACVAVLCAAGIMSALTFPSFTERGTALDSKGRLLAVQTEYQSFLDYVGASVGVSLLATLLVLALGVTVVSLARGSHLSRGTLFLTWVFAAAFAYIAYAVSIVLGPRFWPRAILALVCAVLLTVQYVRGAQMG